MFDLQKLVRKNILELEPYSSARSEYTGTEGVFLDANENPFGTFNRYPDPYQQRLRQQLGALKNVPVENVFIGNGSDEIIDLAIRIFCRPGIDKVLIFTPTYGMYRIAAAINDVALLEIPLDGSFQLYTDGMNEILQDENLKVVFVCSPNNPTGNCLDGIEVLLDCFKGIVVVDEAYIDFAQRPSFINKLDQYPNLIVTQTLSKAWGLAGARIGIAFASAAVLAYFFNTKPPYNVSQPDQDAALKVLSDVAGFEANRTMLLQQRAIIEEQLLLLPFVKKIYPSDANFLLVETADAAWIYHQLRARNIIARNRHRDVPNCIRISVGSPAENSLLIDALQQIQSSFFQSTL